MQGEIRRVLMTADTLGGVFTYALTLASELSRRNVEVHVATMGERMRAEQREAADAIVGLTVHESTFALEWMDDPWSDVAHAADWLLGLEHSIRPDIVHLNGYAHACAGFRAPVIVAAHSCVLSWWDATLGETAPHRYDRYRTAVRDGLDAADVVIAPTHAMLASLEAHHGPVREALVIANGAQDPPLCTTPTPKEPFILAAGRIWDIAKNVHALARVAPRLSWPLKLAGWTAADTWGGPGVEALGWCGAAELGVLMERASLFALPARYEPFGLSALEAALRGCALVLGDIPSLREVWDDAATFVSPHDDHQIEAALERLVADGSHRMAMAERARDRAARYGAGASAAATLAVYQELAQRRLVRTCA